MPIRLRNGLVRYPRVAALAALVMVALGGTALRAQALFEKTDLFVGGQDDYNTFRGPTLLCTKKGTVLAFAEGKHDGAVDGAGSDLVLKRSLGNDRKWTPPYLSPKGEGRTRRNTMIRPNFRTWHEMCRVSRARRNSPRARSREPRCARIFLEALRSALWP